MGALTTVAGPRSEACDPFTPFLEVCEAARGMKHSDMEREIEARGREMMRTLYQAWLDQQAPGEAEETVRDVEGGEAPANTSPVRVDGLYPGEAFRYSGGGFTVMQLIMSDVASEPFPSLMRRLVLDPVGMAHSTYEQPLPPDWSGDVAVGHTSDGDVIRGRWRTYPDMAAAGLWTTPTDLLRWAMKIVAVREGGSDFLSRGLVEEMLTPQVERMGLGVVLRGTGRSFHFGRSGSNVGYRSRVVYYPATGQGAAVLTNGNRGAELGAELFAALAEVSAWPAEVEDRRED